MLPRKTLVVGWSGWGGTEGNFFQCCASIVGHRSIVDKSSAYRAKGPRFKTWWRQEFININCIVCSVHLRKIKLRLGPTFKKNVVHQLAKFVFSVKTKTILKFQQNQTN